MKNTNKLFKLFTDLIRGTISFLRKLKVFKKISQTKLRKLTIIAIIFFMIGAIRFLGVLESWECKSLDWLFQQRNPETKDERIVIVEISESDLSLFKQYPITDYELYILLSKIQKQQPRVIGIDLYRDIPVNPDYKQGETRLNDFLERESNSNIIGVEKVIDTPDSPKVLPHPVLKKYGQIASNDVILDRDSRVRRAILAPLPKVRPDLPSLNYMLAAFYLQGEGIDPKDMKIGSPVRSNSGGYAHIDSAGDQILLNYHSLPNDFLSVKAFDVIEDKISPDLFKNKIVIICTRTQSFPDIFYTPFMEKSGITPTEVYGGWIQANATAQLISGTLDNRPLIHFLPSFIEYLVIALFVTGTTLWTEWMNSLQKNDFNGYIFSSCVLLPAISLSVFLVAVCLRAFVLDGWWLPVVPVVLGIGVSAIASLTVIVISRATEYKDNLEKANAELKRSNTNLKQFLQGLPVGVTITDYQGKLYYNNQAARKILGDRLMGIKTTSQFLEAYPIYAETGQLINKSNHPIKRALEGEDIRALDIKIEVGEDKTIEIETNVSPIVDEKGKVVYAIAAFQDTSERERLKRENQLLQPMNYSDDYQLGGGLNPDASTYVIRPTDRQLYQQILKGDFCYVFSPRQMGKSSLRNKTMSQLQQKGYRCAAIDLTEIGSVNLTPEQWYGTLSFYLDERLQISHFDSDSEFSDWWRKSLSLLSPQAKFERFISQIVLKNIDTRVFIFIDEIDSVRRLSFDTDDFFAFIRSFYDGKSKNNDHYRIDFILLGAATPYSLVCNPESTPFNIGTSITLSGLEFNEIRPLFKGIEERCDDPLIVLKEVLAWTGGQPFLTQKICYLIKKEVDRIEGGDESKRVEKLVKNKIISNWLTKDEPEHLDVIQQRIIHSKNKLVLLDIYQQILMGKPVAWNKSQIQQELVLSGLVCEKNGFLKVFNSIYENIFDLDWINKNY